MTIVDFMILFMEYDRCIGGWTDFYKKRLRFTLVKAMTVMTGKTQLHAATVRHGNIVPSRYMTK